MNFLVLGCNGMVGHLISLYLLENSHKVVGYARRKSLYFDSVVGDAKDTDLVRKVVTQERFDSIINCVGLLNQFAEDNKADAVFLNAFLPHFLTEITKGTQIQVIHISTDCVFNGEKGQYSEYDVKNGKTFYAQSKALGEIDDDKNLTLRQSIVGPDMNISGIGLLNWFMKQRKPVNGFTRVIWTGLTTLELAKVIEKAANDRIHGLYNMVPNSSISKYELLTLFNEYLRGEKIQIIPDDTKIIDKSLVRTKQDFKYIVPGYKKMIIEMKEWIKNHAHLYPHYLLSQ